MNKPYADPYAVLGLARGASAEDIKRAYFALVRAHPPERDPKMFKQVRAAYELLRDEQKRTETDMLLLREWPAPTRRRRNTAAPVQLDDADLLDLAAALSDLARSDWREHFAKVNL